MKCPQPSPQRSSQLSLQLSSRISFHDYPSFQNALILLLGNNKKLFFRRYCLDLWLIYCIAALPIAPRGEGESWVGELLRLSADKDDTTVDDACSRIIWVLFVLLVLKYFVKFVFWTATHE